MSIFLLNVMLAMSMNIFPNIGEDSKHTIPSLRSKNNSKGFKTNAETSIPKVPHNIIPFKTMSPLGTTTTLNYWKL